MRFTAREHVVGERFEVLKLPIFEFRGGRFTCLDVEAVMIGGRLKSADLAGVSPEKCPPKIAWIDEWDVVTFPEKCLVGQIDQVPELAGWLARKEVVFVLGGMVDDAVESKSQENAHDVQAGAAFVGSR